MDLLEEIAAEAPAIAPLTQVEYNRMFKLDAGIKALTAELDELKNRAKALREQNVGIVKGAEVHGKVVVDFGTRNIKDLVATAAKFPITEHPDKWVTPEPVLDLEAIAPKEVVVKPTLTISVSPL